MHSAIGHFARVTALLSFGGHQMVSISVQNFARTTLRKRGFVSSMRCFQSLPPPPLQRESRLVARSTREGGSFFGPTSDTIAFLAVT